MKTLPKALFMALFATVAGSLFAADYTSKIVKFSSTADYYADGAPVVDGEWYALCWASGDTFGGVNDKCEAISIDGEEAAVIRFVRLAKDGCCPLVFFVLDGEDKKDSGNYFVCLLDTRTSANVPAADDGTGRPTVLNSSKVVAWKTASVTEEDGVDLSGEVGVAETRTEAADVEGSVATPAKIVGIEPTASGAKITVENLNPLVSYKIVYGKDVSKLQTAKVVGKGQGDDEYGFGKGDAIISIDGDEARFFSLKQDK